MTPRLTRRRYASGLSMLAVTSLAGCTGGSGDDESDDTETDATDESTPETDTTTEESTTEAEDEAVAGSPADPVAGYVQASATADDPEVVGSYFHPVHPFHPDNIEDEAEEWLLTDREVSNVETEVVEDAEVTTDTVFSAPLFRMSEISREAVAEALDGGRAAVVDATVTYGNEETTEFRSVSVTADGEWLVLAQGIEAGEDESGDGSSPFDTRVVDDVTFDADEDSARVHFVDSPVADSVTVEAENEFFSNSTSTPEPVNYLNVPLDPEGDAVLVSATLDGESRPIHRERYPESHRVVTEVAYDTDPDTDLYDATARVEFTDNFDGERLAAESTVAGGSVSTDSPAATNYVTLGIDPDGDEVVVRLTTDGEEQVVHRERFHP